MKSTDSTAHPLNLRAT